MFGDRGHDLVARFQNTEQRDIQRFGTVFSENSSVIAVPAQKLADKLSAVVNPFEARKRKLVPASAGVGAKLHCGGCGGYYAVGFEPARSRVIEIYQKYLLRETSMRKNAVLLAPLIIYENK